MRKKLTILGVLGAALILGVVYLWGPGPVPAGQQPLTALSAGDVGQFAAAFNGAAGSTRLVLLLSPT